MKNKRIPALLLIVVMLISLMPAVFVSAEVVTDPGARKLYIHARGADYQGNENMSTVNRGDIAEVFFVIDNPNMGDYIGPSDPRNDSILDEIEAETRDIIEKYEEKVATVSQKALGVIQKDIKNWYDAEEGSKKDVLATKINKAAYASFLTKTLDEISEADFDSEGVLKLENVLEIFDASEYADVVDSFYGGEYPYSFEYKYESEYFYISKINQAVAEVESAIEECEKNIENSMTDADKAAFADALLTKYNSGSIRFLEVNGNYDVSFDVELYRTFMRESLHCDRVKVGGAYFVGKAAEEFVRHIEPEYDLNGYTVRIYFDPDFFELANPKSPLRYNAPGANSIYTTETKDEEIQDGTEETPLDDGLWVYEMDVLPEENGYVSVGATIFASGIYFPNREEGKEWYDLCSLPLKPLKSGRTQVFIERPGADEEYPLTLFAKHEADMPDEDFEPIFDIQTMNGGYHTIIIEEKVVPDAPVANPPSGTRLEKEEVYLTAEPDCSIYYKRSGETEWTLYSYPDQDPATISPIEINYTQSIICKAVRTKGVPDGTSKPESREVQYDYTIVPDIPYLWKDPSTQIIGEYYEDADANSFYVYPSDSNETFDGRINDDRTFYYTFNDRLTASDVPDGSDFASEMARDPETQWVRFSNNNPTLKITEFVQLRMIARKNDSYSAVPMYSDISEYMLGIMPKPAYDPAYDADDTYTDEHSVSLTTDNEYDVEIYYTTNGKDPRTEGWLYNKPIRLVKDTTVKTVAKVPGLNFYSEIMTFVYDFVAVVDDRIEAFYPEGTYKGSVDVVLSTPAAGQEIEYFIKMGDFDPDFVPVNSEFEDYDNHKITVDQNLTIYAKNAAGEVYSFEYTIRPLDPIFSPETKQFVDSGSVNIVMEDADTDDVEYTLYYTTDGSDPSDPDNRNRKAASDEYDSVNIPISEDTTIRAVVYSSYGEYSDVITHRYGIVVNKPKKPITTLVPGYYTKENGEDTKLETEFFEAPDGNNIYYTVSYNDSSATTPYPGADGTYFFDSQNPTPIEIKGKTVIKAVAIDGAGNRSDVASFTYIVTPEAPVAAPSNVATGLSVIPVTSVPGAEVTYIITGEDGSPFEVKVTAPEGNGVFYINPEDGLPYGDMDCTEPLVTGVTGKRFDSSITLDIYAEVDGVKSDTNTYIYKVDPVITEICPPYADKAAGTYDEIKRDDENSVLIVKLYSQNTDPSAVIEYRFANEPENRDDPEAGWKVYNHDVDVKLKKYTLLQARVKIGTETSAISNYAYMFKPLAPIIIIPSGTYNEVKNNNIIYDSRRPDEEGDAFEYTIKWRFRHGDVETEYSDYNRTSFDISENSNVMAYVVNNASGEKSEVTTNYYIVNDVALVDAYVKVRAPFDVDKIKTSKLDDAEYVKGIYLDLMVGNYTTHYVEYQYSYKLRDYDEIFTTSLKRYDPSMPILVNESMEYIVINAQVFRNDGYAYEPYTHRIDFEYVGGGSSIKVTGGGGGGKVIDNTRKYTKDIFGNEHPTHIGYIKGYPDGSVQPDGKISREEVTAILYRINIREYDKPFAQTGTVFPDVKADRWSVMDIEFMAASGIVNGYPDGEFKPARKLTRAEFATLVCRFAELDDAENEIAFPDLEADHWAYDEIMSLCESGLMQGYEDGTFRPEREITRAEVMVVVNKILGRNPSESYVKSLGLNPFNDLDINKWHYVVVMEATVTHNYYLDSENLEIKWEDYK